MHDDEEDVDLELLLLHIEDDHKGHDQEFDDGDYDDVWDAHIALHQPRGTPSNHTYGQRDGRCVVCYKYLAEDTNYYCFPCRRLAVRHGSSYAWAYHRWTVLIEES